MKKEEFTYLLQHPENSPANNKKQLEELISNFPYFQAPRAIYLKILKNENSYLYNQELKKTAAYTTDRNLLFEYITSPNFQTKNAINNPQKQEDNPLPKKETTNFNPSPSTPKGNTIDPEKLPIDTLEINKPLVFTKKDKHSFNQWLQLTKATPIQRENTSKDQKETFKLIDKFLAENPKIKPPSTPPTQEAPIPNFKPSEHLMTETLAKVYVQQHNYKKAIQAYKILILKNPQKSGFFADQIRAIEKLQQNNK